MKNIFRFELGDLRGSMAGWSIAVCCFLGIYVGMYPLFSESGSTVADLFARFPETLQALYGMTNLDMSAMTGYLPFPMKLIQELLAVGGLMIGVRTAAHDTRSKCADFLYAMPVSRKRVFAAKAGAVFSVGGLLFAVTTVFLLTATSIVAPSELPLQNLLVSALISTLLFWLYGSAGLLIGTRFPRVRGTAAIGVASMFFFHIVFSICKVVTKNAGSLAVRLLVPVCLFDRELAAGQGYLELPFLLVWVLEVLFLLFLSCRTGRRRDITSA